MLITCTNCATSYEVTASSLGPTGRSVRCARCRHVWFAANTEALADIAEAHRTDVAALSGPPPAADPPPPEPPVSESLPPEDPVPDPAPDAVQDPPPAEGEPVAVSDAPPLAPAEPSEPPAPLMEDIETVAARRAREQAKRRRWRQPGWSTAILALIAINLALVGWRSDIVRWLPQTASLYAAIGLPVNLRGLSFANVTTEKETQENVQVLIVEGLIVNDGKRPAEVPRLRFAIRNQAGQEIYSWTALPARNVLLAGEALQFRTRLASPPREGQQVLVRFFNRRDLVAGVQ
jgi:predicted Zn finger-like uncharacterized protein